MNLLIVESPTKAKTISKFLGKDFKVESSFGHVRDLPERELGVDVENDFEPKYVITPKASRRVQELKKLAGQASQIYFATDEDREGEAISWHLAYLFKVDPKSAKRLVFHEITKDAIENALENPRHIEIDLVDAQQARRILDRLVGYKLSPFLWKKVARGLSAGRVQSVAVRLIVDREREIQNFVAQEYWDITALFNKKKNEQSFESKLVKINDKALKKFDLPNKDSIDKILKDLQGKNYKVIGIEKKEAKKAPYPPFTTSTMQMEANRRLGFSAKQTMMIAQQLYEGINLGPHGHVGLITYMRTDSLNLADKFLGEAKNFIDKNLGEKYSQIRKYKTKSKGAQEAHEAIRPTSAFNQPEKIKEYLDKHQYKLYNLIWQRAIASQMQSAVLDQTMVDILDSSNIYTFRANGSMVKFDGFTRIYPTKLSENELPNLNNGEELDLKELKPLQHFTQPPARYSDATLVKVMEEYGIGRPSTYAPTISTIISRKYVERDPEKRLKPMDIAFLVNDLLVEHFPNIVDFKFTAKMEEELDDIAEGKLEWKKAVKEFYVPFAKNLKLKEKELTKKEIVEEATEFKCEKCGSPMVIKMGRYGKFLACSNYPKCKTTIPLEQKVKEEPKETGEKCEKCGSPMVEKTGRFGKFIACSNYPACKNIKGSLNKSTGVKCPKCGEGEIVQKMSKRRKIFFSCSRYPDCDFALWNEPTGEQCPKCKSLLVYYGKNRKIKCSNKDCK